MWRLAGVFAAASASVLLALGSELSLAKLRRRVPARLSLGGRGALLDAEPLRRARERAASRSLVDACERQMPELLDILGLGLSAGLSFDASLELYCGERNGELAREMRGALLTWRMGLAGRAQALEALSARVESPSLSRFTDAVCEALAFGSPLASTLEHQASALREEQRAATQQRVEEVPVRMLIPLGTLVVPAMLLAILGPLLSGALAL